MSERSIGGAGEGAARPRVLLLAESCNPEWPSLPVVGYKYALALGRVADVTVVTHVRNRENIDHRGELGDRVHYIDNEWLAAPLYRFATWARGGTEVAWSTNQMLAYPPYVAFEWQALRAFRRDIAQGRYDLVHRITPMSPTLPSYIAGRTRQPFVIGPLNGNLDWPTAFAGEQRREREGLRRLRRLYRLLPFVGTTYSRADCVLVAFQHTARDIRGADPSRIVQMPEIGFDPELFHDRGRRPFAETGSLEFLFAGRLVPYKVPEVAVRAFTTSERLRAHRLRIIGDGPELPRLREIVAQAGAESRVVFEGRRNQSEVAEAMRRADVFVFPSIRELGAGVVIEAMASGALCLVTDYGAPGELAADGRGLRVPLQPLEGLVGDYRAAMESCLGDPDPFRRMIDTARRYACELYTWDAKAAATLEIYDSLLARRRLPHPGRYG